MVNYKKYYNIYDKHIDISPEFGYSEIKLRE
jgi:hypothetical protein